MTSDGNDAAAAAADDDDDDDDDLSHLLMMSVAVTGDVISASFRSFCVWSKDDLIIADLSPSPSSLRPSLLTPFVSNDLHQTSIRGIERKANSRQWRNNGVGRVGKVQGAPECKGPPSAKQKKIITVKCRHNYSHHRMFRCSIAAANTDKRQFKFKFY